MLAIRLAAILSGALLVAGGSDASLGLGGIILGTSVLDAVKILGTPSLVVTMDDGHLWQWSDKNGLDREVIADDNLIVKSVLVARSGAKSSPAQPNDLPLLGDDLGTAAAAIGAIGGTVIASSDDHAWRLHGGLLRVTDDADGKIVRLNAFDLEWAQQHNYVAPKLPLPDHRAPKLVKQYTPHLLPPGSGTVVVRVEVDANGAVTDARVIVPSGDSEVDRFEVDSIRRSTFEPATCDGLPCAGVYLDIGGMMH